MRDTVESFRKVYSHSRRPGRRQIFIKYMNKQFGHFETIYTTEIKDLGLDKVLNRVRLKKILTFFFFLFLLLSPFQFFSAIKQAFSSQIAFR